VLIVYHWHILFSGRPFPLGISEITSMSSFKISTEMLFLAYLLIDSGKILESPD